jgi:hypothetical protein
VRLTYWYGNVLVWVVEVFEAILARKYVKFGVHRHRWGFEITDGWIYWGSSTKVKTLDAGIYSL